MQPTAPHRAVLPPPVVVIPGITASTLRDRYPVEPRTLWAALERRHEAITLHPEDLRYELHEPARVEADAPFGLVYGDLIEELRHALSPSADLPTPVFPFAYDWRRPLAEVEDGLANFVEEVIDRTSLLRQYHASGYADDPKVDLVGHSMGGLLIAGMLARHGGRRRIRRVATLGTPFRGSFEAVLRVTTGTADLGTGEEPHAREREAARLTPALYHLLPEFPGAIEHEEGTPVSLFDPEAWQPSIAATIAEAIRLHGRDPGTDPDERRERAREVLRSMLREARRHRQGISDPGLLSGAGLTPDDWLAVVGVGEKTRTALRIVDREGSPFFDLRSADRREALRSGGPDPWETGDGTVPLQGALPPFLPAEGVLAVMREDFGYWEIGDRLLRAPVGLHGMLPRMNLVQRLVAAHLRAGAGTRAGGHPSLWGRPLPGVAPGAWTPPFEGLRERGPAPATPTTAATPPPASPAG